MTTPDNDPDPLRILLVEDSIQSMNLTKGMLHNLGIKQVYTAKDGAEGLDMIGSSEGEDSIDLVLCDWIMPEMNGIELLRQIRSCDPDLLFIMITGQADRASVTEAKAFGINAFLKKPFSADDLRKKLDVASRIIAHRKHESNVI